MSPCLQSIDVYSSVDTAIQCLLTLMNFDSCAVLCLKHSLSFLFAGLANGKVALYHRKTGGECSLKKHFNTDRRLVCMSEWTDFGQHSQYYSAVGISRKFLLSERLWDVDSCKLVSVGSEPVCSLLTLEDTVWASCANQVTVIQGSSLQTQVRCVISIFKSILTEEV